MNLSKLFLSCLNTPYQKTGKSSNYAVVRKRDVLYLFFESSDGANDWIKNLDFPIKPYKRMGKTVWFAHRGFLKEWKEIQPKLANYIANKTVKKIVIAGYSRGAGIALLCHEYVWYNRPDLRRRTLGYGFGCPRVLWGVKTKKLRERWENFTVVKNIDDLITHLPPVFLGYTHVGKMLKVGKKGKYTKIQAHYPDNIYNELVIYEENKQARDTLI
ncbi:MAG: lipase family protein [Clostridia bacterium]|nr:lipase family protein [Clostridia bacterium]